MIVLLLGKGDAEHTYDVSVGGTTIDIGLDDALLLFDERAKLVAGHVHAVKVEEAIVALNVLDAEFDFTVAHGLVVVEVGEG